MVDDLKSIRDTLFKSILGNSRSSDDEDASSIIDSSLAKEIVLGIINKAGKSKDEVIQIISKEIGVAVAKMLGILPTP